MTSAKVDSLGIADDRRLMIVRPSPLPSRGFFGTNDATHRYVTQRQCAALATIKIFLQNEAEGNNSSKVLSMKSHLVPDSKVSINISEKSIKSLTVRYRAGIWDDVVDVVDCGDEVASFVQSVAITENKMFNDVRLVSMVPVVTNRKTDGRYVPAAAMSKTGCVPHVPLTDGFSILIVSEESLDELNRRLRKKGENDISMTRFRPNIVIKGASRPFEEDTWKSIQFGGLSGPILHIVKGCPRCKISTTDQLTAKQYKEPLETLSDFRALGKNKGIVYFGQNAILQPGFEGSEIKVGDRVTIITTGESVWDIGAVQAE